MFETKDSGERVTFEGGMVRDTQTGKTLFHLVYDGPLLERWAGLLTRGAAKYSEGNWMKAEGEAEFLRFRASAARHFFQWMRGDIDEDHAAAVVFNINGAEYVNDKAEDSYLYERGIELMNIGGDLCADVPASIHLPYEPEVTRAYPVASNPADSDAAISPTTMPPLGMRFPGSSPTSPEPEWKHEPIRYNANWDALNPEPGTLSASHFRVNPDDTVVYVDMVKMEERPISTYAPSDFASDYRYVRCDEKGKAL